MKYLDESGKPAFNRGKAPHQGGYHAGKFKGINPFKTWFERVVNGVVIKTQFPKKHKIQPCND